MHIADITMFYAAEGGGVSTYLNAKARWLAQRTPGAAHHPQSQRASARTAKPGRWFAIPSHSVSRHQRLPHAAVGRRPRAHPAAPRSPTWSKRATPATARWAALRVKRRLDIPAVAFYHSDLPRLVGDRFGSAAARAARSYLAHLYRQFDLVHGAQPG